MGDLSNGTDTGYVVGGSTVLWGHSWTVAETTSTTPPNATTVTCATTTQTPGTVESTSPLSKESYADQLNEPRFGSADKTE
ncbi:MAG: hypothetical protein KBD85_03090 [Elusimicrobia bacterium]|nr:hypothetical protein [Elusimicrobiota bacterium]MBP9127998.1 hypothetical protein [Elusimicrobiota bacterium]MBP9698983.1 hypothetical protein [Elusimicrobiota bacterium]